MEHGLLHATYSNCSCCCCGSALLLVEMEVLLLMCPSKAWPKKLASANYFTAADGAKNKKP